MKEPLRIQDYVEAAKQLDCEVAMIMAFADVEAPRGGFDAKGRVTVLFEPHVFWKQLIAFGKNPLTILKQNPSFKNFIYKIRDSKKYPKSSDGVYNQVLEAEKIHKEAAFNSASWGKFQIMGFNAKLVGYKDSIEMVQSFLELGEREHLKAFVNFIIAKKIDKHLRSLNYKKAAEIYNGEDYAVNEYDKKLEAYRSKYLKYNHLKT